MLEYKKDNIARVPVKQVGTPIADVLRKRAFSGGMKAHESSAWEVRA